MSSKAPNQQDAFHSAGKPPTPSSAERPRPPPLWEGSSSNSSSSFWNATTAATAAAAATALPSLSSCLKAGIGVTVALYILNQNHMLPRPLSRQVSQALFWPTLPITVARRLGKWVTVIDDTVIMGGAPFGFCNMPEQLYQQYGVSKTYCILLPVVQ